MAQLLVHIAALFGALTFIYIIGFICNIFLSKITNINLVAGSIIRSAFFNLFTGVVVTVFIFSVFITKGHTIHILLPIPFLIALYIHRTPKIYISNIKYALNIKALLLIYISALPFFLYESYFLIKGGSFSFNIPDIDYNSYGLFSEAIYFSGVENKFINLNFTFPQLFNGTVPYHYFELYLNAIISHGLSLPSLSVLLLITYPLLNTIVFWGLLLLAKQLEIQLSPFYTVLLGLLMLLGGIYFSFYNHVNILGYPAGPMAVSPLSLYGKKYTTILLFSIPAVYCFIKNNYKSALLLISAVVIINIGTIGILGGVCFITLLLFFTSKNITASDVIKIGLFYSFYITLIVLFYKLHPNNYTGKYLSNCTLIDIFKNPSQLSLYKLLLGNIIALLGRFFVYNAAAYILMLALIVFASPPKQWLYFILFTNISVAFGALGAGLANGLTDSNQLMGNVLPLNSISLWLSILLLIYVLRYKFLWQVSITCITLTLIILSIQYNWKAQKALFTNPYSDNYILTTKSILSASDFTISGYLLDTTDYRTLPATWIYRHRPAPFILYNPGYHNMIDLSILKSGYDVTAKTPADIYNYKLNEMVILDTIGNNNYTLMNCIKKYNIKYIFASPSAQIPDTLRNFIKQTITDSASGEKMILLKDL
jgi:hypothetical protein